MTDGDVFITVDGEPQPAREVTWIQNAPCGCTVAALMAATRYGLIAADADQAVRHMLEPSNEDLAKWRDSFIDDEDSPAWNEVEYWTGKFGDVETVDDIDDFTEALPHGQAALEWLIDLDKHQGFTWKPVLRNAFDLTVCSHEPKHGIIPSDLEQIPGQEHIPV